MNEIVEKKKKKKRHFTAYTVFSGANRHKILAEIPGADFETISKGLGKLWQSIPEKEKKAWKKQAKKKNADLNRISSSLVLKKPDGGVIRPSTSPGLLTGPIQKRSGYYAFLNEMFKPCLLANPGLTSSAISTIVAAKWHQLPTNERERYRCKEMAAELSKLIQLPDMPMKKLALKSNTTVTPSESKPTSTVTASDIPKELEVSSHSFAAASPARSVLTLPFPVTLIKVDRTPEPMKYQLLDNTDILSLYSPKGGSGKPNIKVVYTCTPVKPKPKAADERPQSTEVSEKKTPVATSLKVGCEPVQSEGVPSEISLASSPSENLIVSGEDGDREIDMDLSSSGFNMSSTPHPMSLFRNPSLKTTEYADSQKEPQNDDLQEVPNVVYNAGPNASFEVGDSEGVPNPDFNAEPDTGLCTEPTAGFESDAHTEAEHTDRPSVGIQIEPDLTIQTEPIAGIQTEPDADSGLESNAILQTVLIEPDTDSVIAEPGDGIQTVPDDSGCLQAELLVAMDTEPSPVHSSMREVVLIDEQPITPVLLAENMAKHGQTSTSISVSTAPATGTYKIPSPANSMTASALLKHRLASFGIMKDKLGNVANLEPHTSQKTTHLKIQGSKIIRSETVEKSKRKETALIKEEGQTMEFITSSQAYFPGSEPSEKVESQHQLEGVKGAKKIVFDFKQTTKNKKKDEVEDDMDLIYTCNDCKVAFRHDHQLKAHFLSAHTDNPPFQCQYCHETFPGTIELRTHMVSMHRDQGVRALVFEETAEPPFAIYKMSNPEVAPKVIRTNVGRIVSRAVERGTFPSMSADGRFCCSFCGGSYIWKRSLEKHLLRVHVNKFHPTESQRHSHTEKVSVCVGETDETRTQNVIHKNYLCLTCCQSFHTNSGLGLHIRAEHGGKYLCPFYNCSVSYADRRSLKRHIDSTHPTFKGYSCYLCSYCTYRQSSILKHLTYHYYRPPRKLENSSTDRTYELAKDETGENIDTEDDDDDYDSVQWDNSLKSQSGGGSPSGSELEEVVEADINLQTDEEMEENEVVEMKAEEVEDVDDIDGDLDDNGEDAEEGGGVDVGEGIVDDVVEVNEEDGYEVEEEEDGDDDSQPYIYIERFPEDDDDTPFTGHGLPQRNMPIPPKIPVRPVPEVKALPKALPKPFPKPHKTSLKNVPPAAGFKCLDCGKVFAKKSYLGSHFRSHMPQENQSDCNLCFKTFRGLAALKSHRRSVHFSHMTDDMVSCPVCDKVFSQKQQLSFHMRTHRNNGKVKPKV